MAYNLRKRSHSKINHSENRSRHPRLYLHSLPPRVTKSALMTHFGKYGEVEDCGILMKPTGFEYAILIFKKAEDAAAAFARKNHRICRHQLQVFDDQLWSRTMLNRFREKKPANSTENDSINLTGTHLLSLNDDCLMEILSKLHISDLCAVSETCNRLREVARYVFSPSQKYIMGKEFQFSTFQEARRILVHFGPLIPEMSIDPVDTRKLYQQLDLLIRYCGDTLQVLDILLIELNKTLALKFQALFTNSRTIQMWMSSTLVHHAVRSINVFANCKRLESLCIRQGTALNNMIFETTIPTLKSFSTVVDWITDLDGLRSFVVRHPHLEQLFLEIKAIQTTSDNSQYYDVLLEDIVHNLKNLERLKIRCRPFDSIAYWSSVQRLAELQYLKELTLDCAGQSITSFLNKSQALATLQCLDLEETIVSEELFTSLAKIKSIRDIKLRDVTFVGDIHRIPALPQLTYFMIIGMVARHAIDSVNANSVEWEWLFGLVKKSPKLNTIGLYGLSFVMDDDVYLRLVDIIARQSNRATLTVGAGRGDVCVDHQTYVENRNFVKYIEVSRNIGRKRKR